MLSQSPRATSRSPPRPPHGRQRLTRGRPATPAETQTDVLVVGAGPGGSAAAYHLARQGFDVVLVDKATFPREKVCGDGLTPYGVRALERMGVDPLEPGFTRVDGLRTYGLNGTVIDLRWPELQSLPRLGVVRTRYDFDNVLVNRAIKVGARFRPGIEAIRPVRDGAWINGAIVNSDGRNEEIRARFVVAADGASSRFAAQAGVVRDTARPLGIAARRYYRSPRPQQSVLEAFVNLRDEPTNGVMAGYGWIFPLGDGIVNVGAGLLNTFTRFKEVSAQNLFRQFLEGLPGEWGLTEENATSPLLSGPIPMAMNRRPLALPGMLLVGDAAGVVNPFNGEGIAYAMESGELAAELIGDALTRNRPAVAQTYPILLRERYGHYFRAGEYWVRAIGHPRFMRFAVERGFPRERVMKFALRMMANLTDGKDGSTTDRVMHAILALTPER